MSIGKLVEQDSGQTYPLGFEPLSIGRQGDNTVVLSDPQVSRHHAEVSVQGGRWVVRDLGSANGTYVNGQHIVGRQVLNHGDLLRVGRSRFQVEIPGAIARQDTLVDRIPAPAPGVVPPTERSRRPWLTIVAAIALLAIVAVAALLLWPRDGDDGTPTSVAGGGENTPATATVGGEGTPAPTLTAMATARPSTTPLPTIAPPTASPTLPPPTPEPTPEPQDPLPTIGYFRANPSTIEQGQCARLAWGQIENSTRLVLSGVGAVGATGQIDVCLDRSKRYTLEATGPGGTVEETVQVVVEVPAGSIIEYFRVIPSIVAPGQCAQLEWGKVDNAAAAIIEPDLGGVGTPGTAEVCPVGTTTYVLTAENPEGTNTARATLIVSSDTAQQPVIPFFTANPSRIEAGQCTTLRWGRVDYATEVTIDNGIGGVATPDSKELCPSRTTTYVMTAVGPGGTTQSQQTVSVSPGQLADLPDLVIESILFEPNPCYRSQKCKVRIKIRNDGTQDAAHFVVIWAPEGSEAVPVEWDVPGLDEGEEKTLNYTWLPNRAQENWLTAATIDANDEVEEIEEGEANGLEQVVTVLEP
ncbi:MAG: FHA domain-containing protein [Anaerolineae bacterium]|jgi:pSer/pThr/pTyr-binding forkhead associated (FHA) protein